MFVVVVGFETRGHILAPGRRSQTQMTDLRRVSVLHARTPRPALPRAQLVVDLAPSPPCPHLPSSLFPSPPLPSNPPPLDGPSVGKSDGSGRPHLRFTAHGTRRAAHRARSC